MPRSSQKGGLSEYFQCVEMYLYLCKVYIKLDQPLKAIEYYKKVRIDKWMDRWIGRWMNGWIDRWMNGWIDRWMNEWIDRWMNGWIDG